MKKSRSIPSFIGIGAEKCATTWCWACLDEHPQVCMGLPKEINYFNFNYSKGAEWYASHFSKPEKGIVGEISPLYMDDPKVCGRIAADFPDVRIVAVLRDPFQRSLSHLLMDLQNKTGDISKVNASDASEMAKQDPKYIRRSLYFRGLEPYFKSFGRDKVTVLFYEDMVKDPRAFLRALYASVGADADWVPESMNKVVNKTQSYRYQNCFRFLRSVSRFAKSNPLTGGLLEQVNKRTRLRDSVLGFFQVDQGRPELTFDEVFGRERLAIEEDMGGLMKIPGIKVPESWGAA